MYLVGPGNSLGVSVVLPSFTFPLRFRCVSVTFPSTFPSTFALRFRWAIACPTNTALKLRELFVGLCVLVCPCKSHKGVWNQIYSPESFWLKVHIGLLHAFLHGFDALQVHFPRTQKR